MLLEYPTIRVEIHEIEQLKDAEVCKSQVIPRDESFLSLAEVIDQYLRHDVDLSTELLWVTFLKMHADLVVQSVVHS